MFPSKHSFSCHELVLWFLGEVHGHLLALISGLSPYDTFDSSQHSHAKLFEPGVKIIEEVSGHRRLYAIRCCFARCRSIVLPRDHTLRRRMPRAETCMRHGYTRRRN